MATGQNYPSSLGLCGIVRIVTVKTKTGTYKRPVTKVAPLLPNKQRTIPQGTF